MRVVSLRLWQFRCFEELRFSPQPGLNVLFGENGSGKTTVLEALQLLSTGRSFRTGDGRDLIRSGSREGFAVQAVIAPDCQSRGERWDLRRDESLSLRIDEVPERFSRAAARLVYRALCPGMEGLLEASAARRALLDWVLFHVEPRFLETWQRYQRALRQRQALLQMGATSGAAAPWHQVLAETGDRLSEWRRSVVAALGTGLATDRLFTALEVELAFEAGYGTDAVDAAFWDAAWGADASAGYARAGPHRADILLRAAGRRAQRRLSRGQAKGIMTLLTLAAAEVVAQRTGVWPVMAIDDWRSELGPNLSEALWRRFVDYPGQVMLTEVGYPSEKPAEAAWFHVEQGRIRNC